MRKARLPGEIDVLDLFCGDARRIISMAKARGNRNKVFVGVDKQRAVDKRSLPSNVRFVESDVLHFLENRRYGETVGRVHIDYGLSYLSPEKRRQFYWHLRHLLKQGGEVHVTTFDSRAASTGIVARELEEAGLSIRHVKPLTARIERFPSEYTARTAGRQEPRHASSRIVAYKRGN